MNKSLLKSASSVSLLTLVSRLLGFVRDVVFASIFGAGVAFDAFAVAFKIPNFFRRLFAEGAFSQAFVPVLTEYRSLQSFSDTRQFIARIFGTLLVFLVLFVAVAELLSPVLVFVFAPGFYHDPERYRLTQHMLHITFPYLLLIALTALSGAVLNTWHRFSVPAITPLFLNVALISAALWGSYYTAYPIYVLAWGVVLGGLIQLAFQLPFLRKMGLLPRPVIGFRDEGVRRVMRKMVPALFGVSVTQLSLLFDNFFASFLPVGSITWLYYSDRLTFLPLGVIGVAVSTVVLPHLSKHHSERSDIAYSSIVDWALRCILLLGVPASLGLLMLAGPLIVTLLHHGHFVSHDVMMTRMSLMAFAVGLPAFMAIKILASAFYSRQNIKTPVKVAVVAMAVNLLFNCLLIIPLKHAGLALSTAIAAYVNAGVLLYLLVRKEYYRPVVGWARYGMQLLIANAVMAGFITVFNEPLKTWLGWTTSMCVFHLLGLISLSIVLYFLSLWVMGIRWVDFKMVSKQ